MTKAQTTVPANQESGIVGTTWLAGQDAYYAARRLPPPTLKGAEGRTFCFRVEYDHDLLPLRWMLNWAIDKWWSSPLCPTGDADAKMTLKPRSLTLEEIRWLFDTVADCHVAVQTVALEAAYTGERTFLEAGEMGASAPKVSTLKKCLAGLAEWQEGLAANAERGLDAELELRSALHEQKLLRTVRKRAKP